MTIGFAHKIIKRGMGHALEVLKEEVEGGGWEHEYLSQNGGWWCAKHMVELNEELEGDMGEWARVLVPETQIPSISEPRDRCSTNWIERGLPPPVT